MQRYLEYSIGSNGYYFCNLCDIYGEYHSLLVHRVVANSWIGDIIDKEVHHKNENRLDPRKSNLEILSPEDHYIIHHVGENNSSAILTDNIVNEICKLLVKNKTHVSIARKMSTKYGKPVTVEMIDKIATGKNWKHISAKYDIKVSKREKMNQFSHLKDYIGQLSIDGKSVPEIAKILGVEKNSKSYVSLVKCVPRYRKRLLENKNLEK